jgi:hypothetical protein
VSEKKPRKGAKQGPRKGATLRAEVESLRVEVARSELKTQNRIEFIVEQQAQFATDIRQLRETQAALVTAQQQANDLVVRLAQVTTAGFNELRESVGAVADAQIKSEDKIAALADAQRGTDERLNALINTVERVISERQNGKGGEK